jgi:hypothetical protein
MIAEPYSSIVNAAFTRTLGGHEDFWRHYRTNNVVGNIQAWAKQHEVPFEDLCVPKNSMNSPPLFQNHSTQDQLTSRQQAIKLLELLTEEDIVRFVIPTLLSTILVKSRL